MLTTKQFLVKMTTCYKLHTRLSPFIIYFLSLYFLLSPNLGFSLEPGALKLKIQKNKQTLRNEKQIIKKLSKKEKSLYTQLAKIEARVQNITQQLMTQEQELSSIKTKEASILKEYQHLITRQKKTQKRLNQILFTLWPIYLQNLTPNLGQLQNWAEADRYIVWLKNLYTHARSTFAKLKSQSNQISARLAQLQEVKERALVQVKKINHTKDKLLKEKLTYLQRVQEIRARRLAQEERIQEILSTIHSLNYKLKVLTTRDFARLKGYLPWPAKGKIKKRFNLSARPPQRGISLALPPNTTIKSVSWGKVVHNDTLRGFGKVVIIFHGRNYYSLYAFLAKTFVQLGQEVEKGEPIGVCGFYPQLKESGLYFELRFGQKPINPLYWLG
ncbi:peptidoglycan DD-metalloendopeptidase family protein [Desulfohalobiaceae bacterium Ax17]|uniref:murein hydrolase activator EnvC family protein n=1 Tax=Desulfovulcanus ferrireducens TaxID=2831190 RepID=UPI00207B989A|nr:peptidoglycan DD-metalloendopeptidase family protein [Desulfovulcanus ferrireducens]MBT8763896.1 peptidoglycan DD-metalloendopeptidase family protein [Desulfovulcanus ferrireducens]